MTWSICAFDPDRSAFAVAVATKAFAVGASAGIPSIAIGNFTWDWIYGDYPRTRLAPNLLPAVRQAYAKTYMALRLPMWGGFQHIGNIKDIPFIARHATKSTKEVCKALKIRERTTSEDGTEVIVADMTVSFKLVQETFTSRVTLDRAALKVGAELVDGPVVHILHVGARGFRQRVLVLLPRLEHGHGFGRLRDRER